MSTERCKLCGAARRIKSPGRNTTWNTPVEMAGRKFGALTVLEQAPGTPRRWLARCECGGQHVTSGDRLGAALQALPGMPEREGSQPCRLNRVNASETLKRLRSFRMAGGVAAADAVDAIRRSSALLRSNEGEFGNVGTALSLFAKPKRAVQPSRVVSFAAGTRCRSRNARSVLPRHGRDDVGKG